ncbi:FAD-dependent monooxygenase [Streptomyces sp. NPDC057302]|uniref:aromatic-ring hydroxylase C-terminal domain-containing protein n=1 Tax=Streptomyces sp. NPDC057302 TaxID=3346094 RepID=UPI00364258C4
MFIHRTERGMFILLPHDPQRPHVFTTEGEDRPAGNYPGPGPEMPLTEMEDSIERALGIRVPLSPPPQGAPAQLRRLCTRNSCQAESYRHGRVFVGGDAAHASHGPTLNIALGDAANLGWKLAAAAQGRAPEGLLDTYASERRPVAARGLVHTQAETALASPCAETTALRDLCGELLGHTETVRTLADGMVGTATRYDMGEDDAGAPTGWFAPPLTVTCDDGQVCRLAERLHDARPLLLDLTGDTHLAPIAEPFSDRVHRISASADHAPSPALLIRPDGYVAWSGSDPDGLKTALTRWFSPT